MDDLSAFLFFERGARVAFACRKSRGRSGWLGLLIEVLACEADLS